MNVVVSRLSLITAVLLAVAVTFAVWNRLQGTSTTPARRFSGILFGHSFVYRFEKQLHGIDDEANGRSNQDLLQLGSLVNSLKIIGQDGAFLDYLEWFFDMVKVNSYGAVDFLVVDMGSNDLSLNRDPHKLAKRMVVIGHELVREGIVQSIVYLEVAGRAYTSDRVKFAEDRRIFNDQIGKLVRHEPQLGYQRMGNFSEDTINTWSNDGIHPNTVIGFRMYYDTIRKAVMAAIKQCS